MSDESPLSERELQVLERIVAGESNNEIARTLIISPNTVKVHVRNIYSKLGVLSRTEAATEAIRRGFVALPGMLNAQVEEIVAVAPEPEEVLPEQAPEPLALPQAISEPRGSTHITIPHWLAWSALAALVLLIGLVVFMILRSGSPTVVTPTTTPVVELQNEWRSLQALPEPLADAAALYSDGSIYLIGGDTPTGVTAAVRRYEIRNNQWSILENKPTPAASINAALIGDLVFVPGGITQDKTPLTTLEIYDLRTNTWTKGPALPEPRSEYGLVALDGRLHLIGGHDGRDAVATTLIYDPVTEEWSEGAALPLAVSDAAVVVNDNQVYLIGGRTTGGAVSRQTWRLRLGLWEELASLPDDRIDAQAIVVASRLYVIGGTTASSAILVYQPNIWLEESLDSGHALQRHAVATDGRTVYSFGGWDTAYWLHEARAWDPVISLFVPIQR